MKIINQPHLGILNVRELNVLKKIKFLLGCDLTAKSLECKY